MKKEVTLINLSTFLYSFNKILYLLIKKTFDITLSILGIIVLLPLLFFVKIAYLLTFDFNSIIYKQKRIGKNGKIFYMYKIRTMVPDAEKYLEEYLQKNTKAREEFKINRKLKDDPRVTKVGKLLRKTSLDELPQIFNVLKGEMSIIGNRPYLLEEKKYIKYELNTLTKVKPGITGFWQVNGRNDVSFKKRIILEQYYSNNYNIILDTKIFFKTFIVLLRRRWKGEIYEIIF